MDFGKLPLDHINNKDFTLPPDYLHSVFTGTRPEKTKVHVGLSKWGGKEFMGVLYPKGTKEKDSLTHYAQAYSAVEFNASHYHLPAKANIEKWLSKVPDHFKFCPKMYKDITHKGTLTGKEVMTTAFLQSLDAFNGHVGPVFIQLSERFGTNRRDELFSFVQTLPQPYQYFIELRNSEWFKGDAFEELYNTLKGHKIGLVITDTTGRRDILHMSLPVSKAFIRFVGNDEHHSDFIRLDGWIKRLGQWIEKGLEEVYFFVHSNDEAHAPALSSYFMKGMNDAHQLQLKEIVLQG